MNSNAIGHNLSTWCVFWWHIDFRVAFLVACFSQFICLCRVETNSLRIISGWVLYSRLSIWVSFLILFCLLSAWHFIYDYYYYYYFVAFYFNSISLIFFVSWVFHLSHVHINHFYETHSNQIFWFVSIVFEFRLWKRTVEQVFYYIFFHFSLVFDAERMKLQKANVFYEKSEN